MGIKQNGNLVSPIKGPDERFSINSDGQRQYIVEFVGYWANWEALVPEIGTAALNYPQFFLEKVDTQRIPPHLCKITLTYSTEGQTEVIPPDEITENVSTSAVSIKQHPDFQTKLLSFWDKDNDRFDINTPLRGHETYHQGGMTVTRREYFRKKPKSSRSMIGTINAPPGESGNKFLCIARSVEKSGQWNEKILPAELSSLGTYDSIANSPAIGINPPGRGQYYTLGGKAFTAAAGTTCTCNSHGMATGRAVKVYSTGSLPSSTPFLLTTAVYYVRVLSASTFSLHESDDDANDGTDPITFTNGGSGTHTITDGDLEINGVFGWKFGDKIVSNGYSWQRGEIAANSLWVRTTTWQYSSRDWPKQIYTSTSTVTEFPFTSHTGLSDAITDGGTVTKTYSVGNIGTVSYVKLALKITHTAIGDLFITLTSPSGNEYIVWNRTGGVKNNLEFKDADPIIIYDYNGENAQGTWTLTIKDQIAGDTGTLNRFKLWIATLNP